jgi:hypothetical protein
MTTPLNTTKVEVLTIIIGKDYMKYPPLMKEDVGKQNKKKSIAYSTRIRVMVLRVFCSGKKMRGS